MPATDIKRTIDADFDSVLERIPAALQAEGFGIQAEIDVSAALKNKLDVDFRRFRIFGVCNPMLAYTALTQDIEVGVFLPCNLSVYDSDGSTTVMVVDPMTTVGTVDNAEIVATAREARERLVRIVDSI